MQKPSDHRQLREPASSEEGLDTGRHLFHLSQNRFRKGRPLRLPAGRGHQAGACHRTTWGCISHRYQGMVPLGPSHGQVLSCTGQGHRMPPPARLWFSEEDKAAVINRDLDLEGEAKPFSGIFTHARKEAAGVSWQGEVWGQRKQVTPGAGGWGCSFKPRGAASPELSLLRQKLRACDPLSFSSPLAQPLSS